MKYSDWLPRFTKKGRSDQPVRVQERFDDWIEEGKKHAGRPQSRPMMRLVALLIMIMALAYGAKNPSGVMSRLTGDVHPRTTIPVGIAAGEPPPFDEVNLTQAIQKVQPVAQKCLEGWDGMMTNKEGMVVAEVVLSPEGPEEAALYDQEGGIPKAVSDCLAGAMSTVVWPRPDENRSVPFPILGGKRPSDRTSPALP